MPAPLLPSHCLFSEEAHQYLYIGCSDTLRRRTFLLLPSPPRTRIVLQYKPSGDPSAALKGEMCDSFPTTVSFMLLEVDTLALLDSFGRICFFSPISFGEPVAGSTQMELCSLRAVPGIPGPTSELLTEAALSFAARRAHFDIVTKPAISRSAQYPSGNHTHSYPSLGCLGGSAAMDW